MSPTKGVREEFSDRDGKRCAKETVRVQIKKGPDHYYYWSSPRLFGGRSRDRTCDHCRVKAVLSR